MIIVPHTALSPEALNGVIEEFVSRDGTELSDAAEKIAQVRAQLDRGRVLITFDEEEGTCTIIPSEKVPPGLR